MTSYFDETIFTHGETIFEYPKINVFNNADAYLVRKQNIEVGHHCTPIKPINGDDLNDDPIIVNLNPRSLCMGINIHSIMPMNKSIKKMVQFNQISIYDGESSTPIEIGEHQSGKIYTIGTLTDLESAIMLKYFAINNPDVYVSTHLHTFVKKYFKDTRSWFNYNSIGVVQNHKKELIYNNEIINNVDVNISSEAFDFI